MSNSRVGIGAIKVYNPSKKRGVISQPEALIDQGFPKDIYFELGSEEASSLHEGQLVQFDIIDEQGIGIIGKNIKILSNRA